MFSTPPKRFELLPFLAIFLIASSYAAMGLLCLTDALQDIAF